MVLVSDWDNNVNEATALAGLVFDYLSPAAPSPHYKASGKGRASGSGGTIPLRQVMLVGAQALQPSLLFPQESLCLAFKKFYPEEWFWKFQFPMIEDLVNSAPFTTYFDWRQAQGLEWDGPLGPVNASKTARLRQRHAEGQQAGALSQKAALPPLISFGLDPDEHFSRALQLGQTPLPTERMPLLDDDLWFASSVCATPPDKVKSFRQHAIGALKELKQRWAPVTKHLRSLQSPAIRGVTATRDLGLTALLILLSSWADVSYPFGLISGTPAVGTAPNYGIFPAQPGRSITLDEVLEGWESHNNHITRSLKPELHDETLLEQSLKDADQGFCTPPLTFQELQRITKGRAFCLIPRCIIVQSSGKKRIIDNGDTGGQSARSSDYNKLVLCSPLRPAQHIAMVAASMTWEAWHTRLEHDHFESGGEDWPNAYRHTPISEAESLCCVVCFWHTTWSSPAFQVYHSLLFGLPLAVTSFNRYSRLVEALGRRLLGCLTSLYFDDANIIDWSTTKGHGQHCFEQLNALLGTPFAAEKRQAMSPEGLFLGLHHNLQHVRQGFVTFWPRERLIEKMQTFVLDALASSQLTSGTASKIYGMMNFLEQGIYGRIGCSGLCAIKERQQETSRKMTPALQESLTLILEVLKLRPLREMEVIHRPVDRFVAASDAALEAPFEGSGGFLIVWFNGDTQQRHAFVSDIPRSVYDIFTPGEKKIAQLELIQIIYALVHCSSQFRGRRGIWYLDNTAALMVLIRGRSDSADLERMAQIIHCLMFGLRCWFFFEWIESKSNWADAISRLGFQDPWYQGQGFSAAKAFFPSELWHLRLADLIRVAEFL